MSAEKVLVFGSGGMLGRAVIEELASRSVALSETSADITDLKAVREIESQIAPTIVINCAGAIPLKNRSLRTVFSTNAVGPHILATTFSRAHIVQVSTDCVFGGGGNEPHTIYERPDPADAYGKSKLAGELTDHKNATTVRTSFIGPSHGLLKWFLDQPEGSLVNGYLAATWSGSTHKEVARHLVRIALEKVPSLVHLAAPPTTKYDLLVDLARMLRLNIHVNSVEYPRINRALAGTQFMLPVSECVEDLL